MNELPLLSICVTCRDNREDFYEDRGGTRLAQKVFQELKIKKLINMRGVKCMSNCKRACILSLTSLNGFTYMFGDIDPNKSEYIKSLEDLISIYKINRKLTDSCIERTDQNYSDQILLDDSLQ